MACIPFFVSSRDRATGNSAGHSPGSPVRTGTSRVLRSRARSPARGLKDGAGPRKVTRSPSGGLPGPTPVTASHAFRREHSAMKFLCLSYPDRGFSPGPGLVAGYAALGEAMRAAGVLAGSGQLSPGDASALVRVTDGRAGVGEGRRRAADRSPAPTPSSTAQTSTPRSAGPPASRPRATARPKPARPQITTAGPRAGLGDLGLRPAASLRAGDCRLVPSQAGRGGPRAVPG